MTSFDVFRKQARLGAPDLLPQAIVAFIQYCKLEGMGASVPRTVLAALSREDKLRAFDPTMPPLHFGSQRQRAFTWEMIKSLEAVGSTAPIHRRTLSWDSVLAVVRAAKKSPSRVVGKGRQGVSLRVLAAMILTAVAGLLRPGEYLSATKKLFLSGKGFRWSNVTFEIRGASTVAIVELNWTKTHKFIRIVLPSCEFNPHLCPVLALQDLRATLQPKECDAVFVNQFFLPLGPQTALNALRLVWEEEGIDHNGFMLHSARKFGACLLALAGASAEQLRVAGRWSSTSNAMITYCARVQPGGPSTINSDTAPPRGVFDEATIDHGDTILATVASRSTQLVDLLSSEDADAAF